MAYETKDSGERAEYASGMVRDTNKGKPRFDLVMPKGVAYEDQMLTRWALLMARGADKYTERNWEKAEGQEELDRYYESALRHLMQWVSGETDEDHAAAVMFNITAGEYVKGRMGSPENPQKNVEPTLCYVKTQHFCRVHPNGFPLRNDFTPYDC